MEGFLMSIRNYSSILPLLGVLAVAGPLTNADTITLSGSFNQDDNVQLFYITQTTTDDLTIYTSSFASGGFTPVLSLFDASGNFITADDGSQNSGCNTLVSPDPTYYDACWDAFIVFPGAPGTSYILALIEDDNTFQGSVLSDGFSEQGNGDFTGVNNGFGGSFELADGTQRTADWTVNILSADPALSAGELTGTPEPASGWLLLNGIAMVVAWRRKFRKSFPTLNIQR
jgi:hypothetical protein